MVVWTKAIMAIELQRVGRVQKTLGRQMVDGWNMRAKDEVGGKVKYDTVNQLGEMSTVLDI